MVQTYTLYVPVNLRPIYLCILSSLGTGLRDKIFLATKFGFTPQYKIRGDPEFIKSEFATSLERLQTGYVDLLYVHRTDPTVPIETTVGAMAELVK